MKTLTYTLSLSFWATDDFRMIVIRRQRQDFYIIILYIQTTSYCSGSDQFIILLQGLWLGSFLIEVFGWAIRTCLLCWISSLYWAIHLSWAANVWGML